MNKSFDAGKMVKWHVGLKYFFFTNKNMCICLNVSKILNKSFLFFYIKRKKSNTYLFISTVLENVLAWWLVRSNRCGIGNATGPLAYGWTHLSLTETCWWWLRKCRKSIIANSLSSFSINKTNQCATWTTLRGSQSSI